MLLMSVVFHYHGLDQEEEELLDGYAKKFDAFEELKWANEFISKDYISAFDRARDYLKDSLLKMDNAIRVEFIHQVWAANNTKGYITEMEARAMIKLAKDWEVENDLLEIARIQPGQ